MSNYSLPDASNNKTSFAQELDDILHLFKETIESVNAKDYSFEQIRAWSNGAYKKERWLTKIKEQFFLTAAVENKIVGFGSMTTNGYLDFLYVSKNHQRMGIARMIYDQIEEFAKTSHLSKITSDVSITAKPFFEKQGFVVVQEQQVLIDQTQLENFRMEKALR